MASGICRVCGALTDGGPRCPLHPTARQPVEEVYRDPRWIRLSRSVIRAWRGEHGDWCPGWGRPGHPSRYLAGAHRVAVRDGGAPYDRANVSVLCRSCNSAQAGADRKRRATRGGVPPGRRPTPPILMTGWHHGCSGDCRLHPCELRSPCPGRCPRAGSDPARVSRSLWDAGHQGSMRALSSAPQPTARHADAAWLRLRSLPC